MLPGEMIRVELRHRVQLVDISLTGALIACDTKLAVGTHGHFSAALASLPFGADVVLGRHHPTPARQRQTGLGSSFSSMDERSRKHLEQFLRRGSE